MSFGSWLKKNIWYIAGGPVLGAGAYLWHQFQRRTPTPAGRTPQFSTYGQAIPIAYGKTRITGNVIYYKSHIWGDNNATAIGLCEGPISGITRVWKDQKVQEVTWNGGDSGDLGGILFGGARGTVKLGTRPTQAGWSALQQTGSIEEGNLYPGDPNAYPITYPGIAYLGYFNTTSPENLVGYSFEVRGFLSGTGGSAGDAHPADVFSDWLVNADYGCNVGAGRVMTDVGTDGSADSSCRRYTTAEGFWISPFVSEQREAREHLRELCESTNCEVVWRPYGASSWSGAFWFVPYGDTSVTGNSVTYTPDTTIQYELTASDLLGGEEAIEVDIAPETDHINCWPVEFLERAPAAAATDKAHAYNAAVVETPDPVDVAIHGMKRAPTANLHGICLRDVAQKISSIRSKRAARSRATFTFRLPWRFCRLEPLDLVSIPFWDERRVVRITEIEEDSDFVLTVRAEEWPEGIGGSVAHDPQSSEGSVVWLDADYREIEPASGAEVDHAQSTADQAAQDAATAVTAANNAVTSASGKNRNFYQTTAPVTGMVTNDLWFDTDDHHRPYKYTGSAWAAMDRPPIVAGEIDAGAVTAGTIAANAITADKITVGSMTLADYGQVMARCSVIPNVRAAITNSNINVASIARVLMSGSTYGLRFTFTNAIPPGATALQFLFSWQAPYGTSVPAETVVAQTTANGTGVTAATVLLVNNAATPTYYDPDNVNAVLGLTVIGSEF